MDNQGESEISMFSIEYEDNDVDNEDCYVIGPRGYALMINFKWFTCRKKSSEVYSNSKKFNYNINNSFWYLYFGQDKIIFVWLNYQRNKERERERGGESKRQR